MRHALERYGDEIVGRPDEVPLVAYFWQVEAAGEFPSPTCAQQIWTAIGSAPNGAAVVGKFEMVNEPARRGG